MDSREPLAFGSIGVVGKNVGTVTNGDGLFYLDISQLAERDSVIISYLGYENVSTTRQELVSEAALIFALKPRAKVLQAIEIKDEVQPAYIGNVSKNKFKGFNGWGGSENAGKGKQLGLLIDIENEILLTKLSIHIEKNTYDSALMRLHIYSLDTADYPHKELLTSNVLFTINKPSGWVEIDIRKYRISIAADFGVTVEWIKAWGGKQNGDLLTVSRAPNKPGVSLYRGSFLGDWNKQEGELAPAIAFEANNIIPLAHTTILTHRGQLQHAEASLKAKKSMKSGATESKVVSLLSASPYHDSGKSKPIGVNKTSKSTEGFSGLISESNDESGTVIMGIDKEYSVVDFNFHLRFNTFDSLLFALNIYELEKGKTPRTLLTTPIEFRIGKGDGWKTVNLERYKIVLAKDVVVTLRLIDAISSSNKPKDLYFSKSIGVGYHRDITIGEWTTNDKIARSFYLNVRD